MKITKLLVLSGALDQESAGETFCPPHMRMGSSAAFFFVSMPPSGNDEEVTEKAAAEAVVPPMIDAAAMAQKAQLLPLLMTRNPSVFLLRTLASDAVFRNRPSPPSHPHLNVC